MFNFFRKTKSVTRPYINICITENGDGEVTCGWPTDTNPDKMAQIMTGLIVLTVKPSILGAVRHAISAYGITNDATEVSKMIHTLLDNIIHQQVGNPPVVTPLEAFKPDD